MRKSNPAPLGSQLPTVSKTLVHDFLPELKAAKGYVVDKIEGFTIDASGQGLIRSLPKQHFSIKTNLTLINYTISNI